MRTSNRDLARRGCDRASPLSSDLDGADDQNFDLMDAPRTACDRAFACGMRLGFIYLRRGRRGGLRPARSMPARQLGAISHAMSCRSGKRAALQCHRHALEWLQSISAENQAVSGSLEMMHDGSGSGRCLATAAAHL